MRSTASHDGPAAGTPESICPTANTGSEAIATNRLSRASAGRRRPKKEYAPRGQPPIQPKTFNMPGFREVVKCARCGAELTVASAWSPVGTCARCHS